MKDGEQKATKLAGIDSFRMLAAPTQALALDMNQTPLNDQARPQSLYNTENMRIAVNRSAFRIETMTLEMLAKGAKISWTFVHAIGSVQHSVSSSIHHSVHPVSMVKKCPVKDNVLVRCNLGTMYKEFRWPFDPVVNNALQSGSTMTTVLDQLSNGIPFDNPPAKPDELMHVARTTGCPTETPTTGSTQPTLDTAFAERSVSFDSARQAVWTNPLFVMVSKPFLTSILKPLLQNNYVPQQQHKVSIIPILSDRVRAVCG